MQSKLLASLSIIAVVAGGCATGLDTPGGTSVSASAYNRAMFDQGKTYYCGTGNCDTPPSLIRATAPEYPVAALAQGRNGWASVLFDIETTGEISNVRLEAASAPEFGDAALAAIRSWKYKPAKLKGKPVKISSVRQPIPFSLTGGR
jgi:TonB family protein